MIISPKVTAMNVPQMRMDKAAFLDWAGAKHGLFYRPDKQQMTLRLDVDVIAWFKQHAGADEGYQTHINRALREYVQVNASKSRWRRS